MGYPDSCYALIVKCDCRTPLHPMCQLYTACKVKVLEGEEKGIERHFAMMAAVGEDQT